MFSDTDGSGGVTLSMAQWSWADKSESSAALAPGACRNGDWDSLSESGAFLRAFDGRDRRLLLLRRMRRHVLLGGAAGQLLRHRPGKLRELRDGVVLVDGRRGRLGVTRPGADAAAHLRPDAEARLGPDAAPGGRHRRRRRVRRPLLLVVDRRHRVGRRLVPDLRLVRRGWHLVCHVGGELRALPGPVVRRRVIALFTFFLPARPLFFPLFL